MKKYWKLTTKIKKDVERSEKYDHKPTDVDIENFILNSNKIIGEIKLECCYSIQ